MFPFTSVQEAKAKVVVPILHVVNPTCPISAVAGTCISIYPLFGISF
jgi:hypothetical protein